VSRDDPPAPAPAGDDADVAVLSARVLLPFLLVSLIWGSTWLVIKDQISDVPASWSIAYRFAVAAIGMFVLARLRGVPLRIGGYGQRIALALGLFQFIANFQFVYRAEAHITSGLVAVLFAMLMVPNALLGRIFLGHRINAAFLGGSAIALAGIALLFVQEYRVMPAGLDAIALGLGLTSCGILSASIANVMQSIPRVKAMPILALLAWAMLWGSLGNALFAWIIAGPPPFDPRPGYLAGVLYLGLIGSVVTFPLYFALIRDIGPARAAYSSVVVPVVAMILSTAFEGYRWSLLAGAGAALALLGLVVAMQARRPRTPRIIG